MTAIQEDQGADKARQALAETKNNGVVANTRPTLRELVATQQAEIARALPGTVDAARYVRIVQTELRKNPRLMECSPESFLGAVLTAAQLGLEFGPMQQAYLVPYGREIQLIIGYKGWLALMNRSAEIQSVSARTVYANDTFEYEYGLDENLVHKARNRRPWKADTLLRGDSQDERWAQFCGDDTRRSRASP
jgi:recombination protein RecT